MEYKKEFKNVFILTSRIVSFVLIVFHLYNFVIRNNIPTMMQSDFASHFTGAKIVADKAGRSLYNLSVQSNFQREIIVDFIEPPMLLPYINLPFFAYFLTPLVKLGFINGYKVFNVFVILNLILLAYFLQTQFPKIKNFILWPLIFVFYYPNFRSIQMAQTSLFISTVFVLMYGMIKRKKFTITGILTGLLLIKPQYFVVLPFLLPIVKKKRDFLKGMFLTTGVFTLISVFVSGYDFPISYIGFLLQTNSPEFGNRVWTMYSLFSFAEVYLKNFNLAFAVNLIAYMATVYIMFKQKDKIRMDIYFSALLIFAVTFSMHTLVHDLSILSTTIVILFLGISKVKDRIRKAVICLVLFLLFFSPFISLKGSAGVIPLLIYISGLVLIMPKKTISQRLNFLRK